MYLVHRLSIQLVLCGTVAQQKLAHHCHALPCSLMNLTRRPLRQKKLECSPYLKRANRITVVTQLFHQRPMTGPLWWPIRSVLDHCGHHTNDLTLQQKATQNRLCGLHAQAFRESVQDRPKPYGASVRLLVHCTADVPCGFLFRVKRIARFL